MRDFRTNGDATIGSATGAGSATPGKRTLIERYGSARIERRGPAQVADNGMGNAAIGGNGADAQVQLPNGPDVENPLAGPNGIQNGPGATRTTVTLTESTAAPLTFNAKDYRDLYGQVAARVGKEAGTVTRSGADINTGAPDGAGNIPTAVIKYDLATMLPEWPQKGTQPAEDQAKFNAWRASVSEHEKGHRDVYKRELGKERTQVIGPKSGDIDTQISGVEAAAETAQDAWDAAGQPAPLAAPGGIEKVGPNGQITSDASADQPAGDTATV